MGDEAATSWFRASVDCLSVRAKRGVEQRKAANPNGARNHLAPFEHRPGLKSDLRIHASHLHGGMVRPELEQLDEMRLLPRSGGLQSHALS
jgi:hypothetical protein